ncbi:MAG TPA: tetratricopeptide repeat protein, partial [Tepidisphaeraceae bacterium]
MARKLNKALVAAVASVALLSGGAYVAAPKILQMMRPVSDLVAAGDAAAEAGEWEKAALNYGKAANRSGNDIDLQLKYVNALDHTVNGEVEKLRQVRQFQAQILANDPRSVPALRQVLAYQRSDVQRNPADTAAVRTLAGTAERLEKLVPGDREARLAMVTSVFEPYTRNLEVRAEDVEAQRAAVEKLYEEKPDDADALRMAVQFRSVAAQRALQQGDTADAKEKLTQTMAYVDAAVEKTPQSAGAWVLRADTYRFAAYVLPGNDTAQRDPLVRKYSESLQKADELAKPGDPLLMAIRTTVLRELERRDPKQAEVRYRKLLEELPDDRQPRVALAEFLARQPNRRDEAVAVLEAPFKPTKVLRGMDSVDQRMYGLVEQVRRASIRLGALMTATDPEDRKKRIDAIDQEYRAMRSDPDISTRFKPAVLRVQGGLELAQGKVTEAISTLDSALKLIDPASQSTVEQDIRNDTLMEYAQAQLRLNQSGEARPALAELVQRKPENLAARAMLADLLIRERSLDAAEQQVQVLERMAGDSPVVQKMRLQILLARGSLKDRYPQLAETSREQRFLKLQVAGSLNDNAEVARMASLILSADPTDRDAVTAFVQASLALNRRDEAVNTVAAALKAKPGDAGFKAIAENLAAVTPEDRQRLISERVENLTDPYIKTLNKGELARSQGRPADAIEAYKEAQKIKPDDARAFEVQFQLAVASRRFADAESVIGDLARLNVDQAAGALRRVQLAAARALVEIDPMRRGTLFKDVVAQAQAAAQQNSQLGAASLLYAQVLQQTGDINGAIDQYQ